MLGKWPVFAGKTRIFAENIERFTLEKETSFTELILCRACWRSSMVAIFSQALDVV
jgi:hypothetical protein